MPQLKEVQQAFADAIYSNENDNLANTIMPSNIDNSERIQIYRDNVLLTLYDTLKNRYPAILKLVDEDFFKYITDEYIKDNQPVSGNLDEYGKSFIDFVALFPAARDLVYLSDIAKLEWALHAAYFAADADPIDKEEFAKISPEQLQITKIILHPSTHLISSPYPIDQIWQLTQDDYDGDADIDINERGVDLLIVRPEYKIETIMLEASELVFLRQLLDGDILYQAFEKAISTNPDFDLSAALQKFAANGTFVGFRC